MTIHDSIYGKIEISEPVLLELINTPATQRLKGVDQTVTGKIVEVPWGNYTRFDHSVGVMWLIKKLGGNLEEQIAGLLHDISHTAFSHIIDFVFDKQCEQNFHEEHMARIIRKSAIPVILQKYDYSPERIINHRNFSILEQPIPALCADRVDYALKTFEQTKLQPNDQIRELLNSLTVHQGQIVFNNLKQAKWFADWFLVADRTVWGGSPTANVAYHLFAKTLKKSYHKGLITLDDFFTTDEELLNKLDEGSKQEIASLKTLVVKEVTSDQDFDLHINAKIRFVDPLVKISKHEAKKLSELNPDFNTELERALEKRKLGNYVKIISDPNPRMTSELS